MRKAGLIKKRKRNRTGTGIRLKTNAVAEKPNETLGMKTPAMIYTASEIKYDGIIEDLENPGTFRTRLVTNRGYISIKRRMFFIGNPFMGYYVGLRPQKDGQQNVWSGDYF